MEKMMTKDETFMDELLAEAEQKEELQTEAYFDLLLLQIQQLEDKIAFNFSEADKEVKIIQGWALKKNHALHAKIEWNERKLEAFIRERKEKTIDLAHGVLKFHKKPDKLEIADMDLFLKNAKPEMLTVIPEQIKPDLTKIKAYTKAHLPPKGVIISEGREEFSYKLNNQKEAENAREKEAGVAA
jgi:hypothetical protein